MKGSYRIIVQNKRICYDFEIRRNITIIKGDSATGKTTLIDMIGEYDENGPDSGIDLQANIKDSIVFIDEGNAFIFTDEFASAIKNTDNYYVIATREGIPSLPYSIEEIYFQKPRISVNSIRMQMYWQ
ncbi:MAG TPA: Fis family transcriptional regulator [Candidatus Anaerobutyricum stercoris]|uniref:Fis family transcriptional regulator n=1 Tax=Candidatus Anaerobutyricum stercoris TaxID=2838457 RepID=A0A9D2EMW8_9FIRM|nr:Fis family transcriptional regulator [Candidatus Anaerobutyricum stercoris]